MALKNDRSGISDLAESSESGSDTGRPTDQWGQKKGWTDKIEVKSIADHSDCCEMVECARGKLIAVAPMCCKV